MNILKIVPQVPYPLDNGARIVMFNTTKQLAQRGHFIIMLALGEKRCVKPKGLEEYCRLEVVPKNTNNSLTGMVFNLFTQKPYTISKYYSFAIEQRLSDIMSREKIDIVHVDHLHMASYGKFVREKWGVPIVLREHNVETTIWKRFYSLQNNPASKAYAFLQYKRVKAYEKEMCQAFDRVLAITRNDQERINQLDPSIKVSIIPAGVDTSYFYPQLVQEERHMITFVGSMDWEANIDGVLWFAKRVFPRISGKNCPKARLWLVGSNPRKEIKKLRSYNIEVRPNVSDVREYLSKSEIIIVPLRIGGGMRLKILEALAMKKPVVSTSVGCEGIDVKHKRDLLVADTEEEFARSVLLLIEDKSCREKLALQGYNTVLRKYSWEEITKSLEAEYYSIILENQKKD